MMTIKKLIYLLPLMVMPSMVSCGGSSSNNHSHQHGDTIPVKYATNLTMVDYGDFIKADFRNPWDTTRTLQTYLLVPRDKEMPTNLPKGTVVRTPLESSIVYTSVHNSLVEELGAIDAIKGVCDAKYIHKPALRSRIESGAIEDCGTSMAPNIEKILMLKPDAILLSAFENSNDHNKVAQIGIPIIDCTDYMEASPLARAEWMRFYGRLYGRGEVADSLFAETERAYIETKNEMSDVSERPVVLSELIFGQTWNVPGALSTVGVLIEDAGGSNPFNNYKKSGSVQLAPEEVLYRAKDADIWLVKYSQNMPVTLTQLGKDNPIYTKFRAYETGNIYGCDTDSSSYFEDAAFHPHWILAEYASIFHPEKGITPGNYHYYKKIDR